METTIVSAQKEKEYINLLIDSKIESSTIVFDISMELREKP